MIDRGFTGHEHLDWAGLINMNGRMYDPVIGRFLGVDPLFADGDNSQSFNSYSYTINNPLRFIDRDGFRYEDPYYGGPPSASISTWSLDRTFLMRELLKDKRLTYIDCVVIASGSQDADDVYIMRLLQLQYGAAGGSDKPQGGWDTYAIPLNPAIGVSERIVRIAASDPGREKRRMIFSFPFRFLSLR